MLGALRHLLREIGVPWYLWLVIPFVVIAVLARKEAEWMPDAADRRKWALRIVVGAILLSLVGARLSLRPDSEAETVSPPAQGGGRADPHGR